MHKVYIGLLYELRNQSQKHFVMLNKGDTGKFAFPSKIFSPDKFAQAVMSAFGCFVPQVKIYQRTNYNCLSHLARRQ